VRTSADNSHVDLKRPLTVAVAALVVAGGAQAAEVSANWGGYAISGTNPLTGLPTSFTTVSASWVAPKVVCTPRSTSYSSFWVGLGGFSEDSRVLEQIGTESSCIGAGATDYGMWYELAPAPMVHPKLKIFVGNRVSASVTVVGTNVTLRLDNLTRHTFFQKTVVVPAPDLSSAEWIAEAPTACNADGQCGVLPLANFRSVSFTQAVATGDGHTGPISDTAWLATPIWLVAKPARGAVPGALSPDGTSFSIAWQPAVTPPSP
jgi:hypothetical protein